MTDHAREEHRVEPGEWAGEAGDKTPVQRKVEVAGVVDFTGLAVWTVLVVSDQMLVQLLTPPIDQDLISGLSRDRLRVLHGLPRQLREGVSEHHRPTLLLTETVLLTIGGVPHPVHEEIPDVQDNQEVAVPVVFGRRVVRKVDGAMAVAQWHAREVPENQHEAPFLIVHIPEIVSLSVFIALGVPNTHQVDTMHSSPLEQAFAYRKCAITRNATSPET